jgi:hypothetical protein
MKRFDPIRIETMPMRGTDREGKFLREGARHLIYRGPLRIGEIEETTAVHENGEEYGLRLGLSAMCLRDPECSYPTTLLDKRFKTVAAAVRAIKRAEQQWLRCLPKEENQQVGRKAKRKVGGKEKRP